VVVSIASCRLRNPDAALGQAGDGVDQVPRQPSKPVQFQDDQGVAGAQLVQDLLEDRTVAADAAGRFGEDPGAAGALEGVDLEVWLLVGGGDAGIAEQMTHRGTVAEPCDSGGCATLIVDTGSERLLSGSWGGGGLSQKRGPFSTADL
jgi:hypothetical protein